MKKQFYLLFYVDDIFVAYGCIQVSVLIFTFLSKYFL